MSRWLRMAIVMTFSLGLTLSPLVFDVAFAANLGVETAHHSSHDDCEGTHAAHAVEHGDHEAHCCASAVSGAFLAPNVGPTFALISLPARLRPTDQVAKTGLLYGIFRPPRDA